MTQIKAERFGMLERMTCGGLERKTRGRIRRAKTTGRASLYHGRWANSSFQFLSCSEPAPLCIIVNSTTFFTCSDTQHTPCAPPVSHVQIPQRMYFRYM